MIENIFSSARAKNAQSQIDPRTTRPHSRIVGWPIHMSVAFVSSSMTHAKCRLPSKFVTLLSNDGQSTVERAFELAARDHTP